MRTLTAAKDVAGDAPFKFAARGLILPQIRSILRLDHLPKKGPFLETNGLPAISLKFWRNLGQSVIARLDAISNSNRG